MLKNTSTFLGHGKLRWLFAGCCGGYWLLWLSPLSAQEARDLRAEALRHFGVLEPVAAERLEDPAARLGQALFWDTRLSADGQTACASCHAAEDGGADRRRFSPDARGRETARNSQTVFNAALQPALRWTGDRRTAAHQAERSLTGSMGFAAAEDVVPLLRDHGYTPLFQAAFPGADQPLAPQHYAKAIAVYEQTLLTPAPFDQFLQGDETALSAAQKSGLRLFIDQGCVACHDGPWLGGAGLETFGQVKDYWTATGSEKRDAGLFESTQAVEDRYRFRVSMLRNIARTAPYFHDGSVADLPAAIRVMADVQLGVDLPAADVEAIADFLGSLSGEIPQNYQRPKLPTGPKD